jgi:divalent metal cation (Fe/Co/Zn/Cd) transporter
MTGPDPLPAAPGLRGPLPRRAVRLEQLTIGYNLAEGLIAVTFGVLAGSIALTGFGFDSWIEVAAATVVLQRLLAELRHGQVDETRQRRALRFIAITFFALAAYLTVEGLRDLLIAAHPQTSPVGIGLTAASLLVMPTLARFKRQAGQALGSPLVIADAAETRLCAWLSVSTLAGLVAYATIGWTWIDPAAGFVIAAFALKEGKEAWEGELACDDD